MCLIGLDVIGTTYRTVVGLAFSAGYVSLCAKVVNLRKGSRPRLLHWTFFLLTQDSVMLSDAAIGL